MPEKDEIRMRYPAGDPENGPAYPQRWTGSEWVCAGHSWKDYEEDDIDEDWVPTGKSITVTACRFCGELFQEEVQVSRPSVIPCHRGAECFWPACDLACDGRPGRS